VRRIEQGPDDVHYVTVRYRNVAEMILSNANPASSLGLRSESGARGVEAGGGTGCPTPRATQLAPGGSVTQCRALRLPGGQRPFELTYPSVGERAVVWRIATDAG
jgi:hypothetical protein